MRTSNHPSTAAALALAASMLALVPAARAFDVGLHVIPGDPFYACLSYDGQVVGTGYDLYTQAGVIDIVRTGYYHIPLIHSLNDNGTIFGGSFQGGGGGDQGVIDRGLDDYTFIGQSSQENFIAVTSLSGDGTVGLVNHQSTWDHDSYVVAGDGTRFQDPYPASFTDTFGDDLSRNGEFAVGHAYLVGSGSAAYRHEVGVGFEILSFPSATATSATCISADGAAVAGRYNNQRAYIWTNGVYSDLVFDQLLYSSSYVAEMNDDATVLVGFLGLTGTPNQFVGALWFQDQGWVVAQDYFASLGIFMPQGRTIRSLTEVSSNGQTFLGYFDNEQYFVVTVPAPSSLALFALTAIAARRRR